jgi:SAM-dependent methyltransferase
MSDSGSFHEFEHAGWENVPEAYHNAFGALTTQAIDALLDAVRADARVKLLDIASGPGYVAAAAAERGSIVIGVDFSRAMVAHAAKRFPTIDFREGDAEQLPFAQGLFDAAVMNFGLLHLARPEQALREAQRALRSGGRFAFTVWAKPDEAVGFRIVLRAVEAHGEPRVQLPEGPPFFRFSDEEECVGALRQAGFDAPTVSKVKQVWRFPVGDWLFQAMKDGTVRTAALLRAQTPMVLDKIRHAIRKDLEPYCKGDHVELPMPAVLAVARKK